MISAKKGILLFNELDEIRKYKNENYNFRLRVFMELEILFSFEESSNSASPLAALQINE